jgi:uroporphyrinogen decarboxylase
MLRAVIKKKAGKRSMGLAVAKKTGAQKSVIQSLEGIVTARVPFWLMRQAGRYLPEYRAVREKAGSFLDLCFNPDLAAEVTLQPVRRFDTDAAILFSDILVIPHALGQSVSFIEGEGPRLGGLSIENLSLDQGKLQPVYDTVARTRAELAAEKTLIGFAGAPWTVACYMVQGRGDREFTAVKRMALENDAAFGRLIDLLTDATIRHLSAQIRAGADCVQLFDSWAGLLPEPLFKKYAIEPARKIVEALRAEWPDTPVIGFPKGAGALYPSYATKTRVNGVSLDTQVPLGWALREMSQDFCLQGNLDPAVLLAGGRALDLEVMRILNMVKGHPFIFNLGHGVIKETPPGHVARLAALVRAFQR